jgi:hypothetical protein
LASDRLNSYIYSGLAEISPGDKKEKQEEDRKPR